MAWDDWGCGVTISVHIERLVLDGMPLAAGDTTRVHRALESELARLVVAGGLTREVRLGGAIHQVRGGSLQLERSRQPDWLGQRIAQALYSGIGNRR